MFVVGIIADTHGLLAERLCPALAAAKVTHILHAGDVGPGKLKPSGRLSAFSLLAALAEVSPVSAVRGNTDDDSGSHGLPAALTYNAGALRFFVHHGDQNPHWKDDDAVLTALRPADGWRPNGDIIVSGHSHVPRFVRHASGVFFLNPGTAGGPKETNRFGKKHPQQFMIVQCQSAAQSAAQSDAGKGFDVSVFDLATGAWSVWVAQGEAPAAAAELASGAPNEVPNDAATGVAASTSSRKRSRQSAASASADASPSSSSSSSPATAAITTTLAVGGEVEGDVLLGTISGCFLKRERGEQMTRSASLALEACLGIAGDVHANERSPRQVLLAATCESGASGPSAPMGASLGLPPGALRENLHLSLAVGLPARLWPVPSGSVLSIGRGGAALRISFACEPCAKGAATAGVSLSELTRDWKRHAQRGLLATALRSGTVRDGDEVRLLAGEKYAPLESEHPARVRHVLGKLPRGRVLPWTELAQLAGAPTGFSMRGMPGLLKKAAGMGAPSWRVVDSSWKGIPQHLPQQKQLLEEEGVEMDADGRVKERERVRWEPSHQQLYWDLPE